MDTRREIVEHEDFVSARRALNLDVRVLDEILEGTIEVISLIPEAFGRVEYTNLRTVATRDWSPAGKPRFIVYFSWDKKTDIVMLHYIHRHEISDTEY